MKGGAASRVRNEAKNFLSAHVSKTDIAKHEIGIFQFDASQRLAARSPPGDAPSLQLQAALKRFPHDRIVFHDPDQPSIIRHGQSPPALRRHEHRHQCGRS